MSLEGNPPLAEQGIGALAELLAGLVAVDDTLPQREPADVAEGLIAAVLRVAFLLLAEQRGLSLERPVHAILDGLRRGEARDPGSLAWTEIQAIFRAVVGSSERLTDRAGLLDPEAYPFLDAPLPDAVTLRVLEGLDRVGGATAAPREPPIEGLGGLYEVLLGVTVVRTEGLTVALRPDHALLDLDALLAGDPEQRPARIEQHGAGPTAPRRGRALVAATSRHDLLRALAGRRSPRTPCPILPGSLALAPTATRRRSGSHYTPAALTAEVVAATLTPLVAAATSGAAVLGITVCDPAMGSGAFLLEAGRFLADRWLACEGHDPASIPAPEVSQARLLVAERCLHGVDKDPVAVELARLSLWMLAGGAGSVRAFLGASLRCGDSLLGARRDDLAAYPYAAFGRAGRGESTLPLSAFDAAGIEAQQRALDAWTALWLWPAENTEEAPRAPAFGAYLAAALAGADDSPGIARARSIARAARLLHWPIAFAEVFARGGFDAVLGNPPWVAYAGRAAQPLAPQIHTFYRQRSPAFFGYRTLHGLFVHLGATLLRAGGRLGLILPTSVADLGGYRAARRAHDRLATLDAELLDFGAEAFEGVFQPAMALLSTRRAGPPDEAVSGSAWRLARTDLDLEGARLLERLSALPPLPPALFGERGYQTMSDDAARLSSAPTFEGAIPLREGRDVGSFLARPPRVFLDARGIEDRIRSAATFREVKLLIRQTARFPIAALGDGVPFRNSILAGFAGEGLTPHFLVAYLNSSPIRWLHFTRFRDARQGMPQVKVAHLRAIPAPPNAAAVRDRLEALGRDIGAKNRGIEDHEAALVDALVAEAMGLSDDELARVRAWAGENRAPRSVYDCD